MNIAIDIDEVLADSVSAFIRYMKRKHSKEIKVSDFTSMKIHEVLRCTVEDATKFILDYYDSTEFEKIKPYPHSSGTLSFLAKKHRLFAVTNRPESTKEKTLRFLGKNFGNVFYDTYFTGQIIDKPGSRSPKADLIEDTLDCQYFIDDNTDNFTGFSEKVKLILFSQPWNKNYQNKDVVRVGNWEEIRRFFKEL